MTRVRARWVAVLWALFFSAIALVRIGGTYRLNSACFDEPAHIAASVELLDKATYTIDTVHPPLSRWTIGIPLYLSGLRYPAIIPTNLTKNYDTGNVILYESGDPQHTLTLARMGVLPFFLLGVFVVFCWTRQEYGDFAAVVAVALFTSSPVVLAFSCIAYTDMAAGATQAACLFALVVWLRQRTTRSSILLGISVGLACLAKFTAAIFLPAAALAILAIHRLAAHNSRNNHKRAATLLIAQFAIVLCVTVMIVWGGYRFSTGHLREAMQLPVGATKFLTLPTHIRSFAVKVADWNPVIPAPGLLNGLSTAWHLNQAAPRSYLLGKMKRGGWWYFYPVALTVKSPIPFLVLALVGFIAPFRLVRPRQWTALAPMVSVIAVLVASTVVNTYVGVRHVMVVFPLLSIVAGDGGSYLWRSRRSLHGMPAFVLATLLIWQGVSSFRARRDFIAYFNELAGRDPSRVLVEGCDLDCGQDLIRLADELRARDVSHLELAVWTSADMSRMGLPEFTLPQPYTPTHGWLAISMRSLRAGDLFHREYPPDAFEWLSHYQPVKKVGSTIWLYYLP